MFPIYAFPPAFATAVIVALAVVSVLYGRRDRLSVSFSAFCLVWAVVAGLILVLQLTGSLNVARLAPAALWFTYAVMGVYVLVLTGHDRALRTPVFRVRPDLWLAALFFMAIFAGAVSATTDFVVTGVYRDEVWGYHLVFGPNAVALQLPFGILESFGVAILVRAWWSERSTSRRSFLRNNLIAIVTIFASVGLFGALMPRFGLATFPAMFDMFTLVAFFFFGVIANYQFRRVEELNASLEARVKARTRELEQMQARLVQAEKTITLGRLVAGVAHEINTPLGAIKSMHDTRVRATSSLFEKVIAGDGDDAPRVERIQRALQQGDGVISAGLSKIDGIVKRLKTFARLDESELQTVDLNQALDEVLALLGPELSSVTVERRFDATRKVTCMSRQINQVFLDVLTNAIQAIDHRGTVRVETADAVNGIRVRVRDDGPGIAPEHQPHVFDPGFTTKGVGVGTGMGLAIAYRVVSDHGGTIAIDSEPGRGTCVTVDLPAAQRNGT